MQSIPIASIRIENRLRSLDSAKVAELAASIAELGLLQPIGVRPDGTLVYGYHRLEACKRLGWTEIPAVVVDGDDLHAELAEIDENLIRSELTVLEQAEHIGRRKRIYEQLYPHAKPEVQRLRGLKPFQNPSAVNLTALEVSIPKVPTFVQDTAQKLGVSERTARRLVQIDSGLLPEVKDQIRHMPIADNESELLNLARLEPREQQSVAALLASGEAKTVKDAVRHIRRREIQEAQADADGDLPPTIQIRHGDFREVLGDLRGQVDAMITDPPYLSEYLPLYGELAKLAAELLRSHGVLVVMTPHLHLLEVANLMTQHLRYRWICVYHMGDTKANVSAAKVATSWKPLLVFTRYDAENLRFVCSDYFSGARGNSDGVEKTLHHWQQSLDGFTEIVQRFTEPGDLVVDPFLGSGTTALACLQLGRRFVGCDINAGAVAIARRRVQDALKGGEQP
jgi:ParB family chromosome partitioning protein